MIGDTLLQNLQSAASGFASVSEGLAAPSARTMRSVRRATRSSHVSVQLVDVDGLLMWEETAGWPPGVHRFRRGTGAAPSRRGTVAVLEFERLAPSQITSFLVDRDKKLTPHRGLRRWEAATRQLVPSMAPESGEVLLLIHGTFSNGDNFINSLLATHHGREFLEKAVHRYKGQVYAFDHPTLSVSPILNAMDLAEALGPSQAQVDVVAHSRGGLVTRWWCERFDQHRRLCRKAILVGSPLAGTGLASPANLRNTIHLLTQVGQAAGIVASLASMAVPILSIVQTLLQAATSMTSLIAKTPTIDGVISMVPGIFGQSRVGNSQELIRLISTPPLDSGRYYFVKSNFEPTDPTWAFWRHFRKDKLAHFAADSVFDGPNDLVVDTDSMTALTEAAKTSSKQVLDFGTSSEVHHLNYFQFERTTGFLSRVLSQ